MNKIVLLGNLGSDAELKVLSNGNSVLKFSVATSESWKDKETGEKKEKTQWHRCQLWGKRAEALANYLSKGTKVLVEGAVEYSSYEKDGVKQYATDIKVSNVEFAGGGKRNDAPEPAEPSNDAVDDSEIPF